MSKHTVESRGGKRVCPPRLDSSRKSPQKMGRGGTYIVEGADLKSWPAPQKSEGEKCPRTNMILFKLLGQIKQQKRLKNILNLIKMTSNVILQRFQKKMSFRSNLKNWTLVLARWKILT